MAKSSAKKTRRTTNSTSEDDSEKEYQVEAILDKRTRGKKTQYLLKWKGYSSKHNSWEDERRLNCPDLFRQFKANWKGKNNKRKLSSQSSKDSSSEEIHEAYLTADDEDDDQSTASENENNRLVTRNSTRKKARLSQSNNNNNKNGSSSFGRRHSTRKNINQTKSRIISMSKNDSSTDDDDDDNDDIYQQTSSPKKQLRSNRKLSNEISINSVDDDNENENVNRISIQSRKNPITKSNKKTPRLRIVPSATSSISYTYNNRDGQNRKTYLNDIVDETDQVQRIEAVRNDQNEILFHIKFFNEDQLQWVSSKIANRKYPQAVISFWESHVEFS